MEKSKVRAKKKVDEAWKAKVKGDKVKVKEDKAEVRGEKTEEKIKEGKEEAEPKGPLSEPDFSSFVSGLGMQALMLLGELTDPKSKEAKPDYEHAKYTIDLIDMLKKKTEGNLTEEESHLVENLLYDLRMKYVKAIKYV
ncbi:DUF1844 domain-containing protein [bacterium]|nr:DUF1844 domain-containing protein [bacterium]MCK4437363.1 DUF1844 domain-containing protein [bacterium]